MKTDAKEPFGPVVRASDRGFNLGLLIGASLGIAVGVATGFIIAAITLIPS